MSTTVRQGLFRLLRVIERAAAYGQGKGYGAATVRHEVQVVQRLLHDAPALAIDVGGNIGDYTAELRRRNGELEIHTFEPSATNIAKLDERFHHDRRVHLVPAALSDTTGAATLFADRAGSGLGSLTRRKLEHLGIPFETVETIQVMRFEDYWRNELQSRPLDIVKLDIEGHEMSALRGFGEALQNTRVVQFEFGGCNIDTRVHFRDFWYFFSERNFSLYRITPLGVEPISRYRERDESFSTTNYVAVRRK